MTAMPIFAIVQQHAEESVSLRHRRCYLIGAARVDLFQLNRLDQRLTAHLDGLAVAGGLGAQLAMDGLQSPGCGEAFTATVRALQDRHAGAIEKLIEVAQAKPELRTGLLSAFGWVSAASLRGITRGLLDSPNPFKRQVGLAACAMHRVDPGVAALAALHDDDAALRTRALRVIAACGRVDLLPVCTHAMNDDDAACANAAMRAALLLGNRGAAMSGLRDRAALLDASGRRDTLSLLLKSLTPAQAQDLLKAWSNESTGVRVLTWAFGVTGDPQYVPWLIHQMQHPPLARLAGESFSTITGLDLAKRELERLPPEDVDTGPSDDPDNEDVSMDEDDGLPWPDLDKVAAWWQANGYRFTPGTRYFMGQPPSPAHCLSVLKNGFQRQRIAAAEYLTLMNPGTPLFNCAAPAWRQQRWLAAMGA
ncbi:TIGR02270 family protein [soil metagenome]